MSSLSLVIPVFNEAENVGEMVRRCSEALRGCAGSDAWEVIFVDDGSSDDTAALVHQLASGDARIRLISLSRNFGHQAALFAGLESARGDAVITLDGDGQHPPELIPTLVARWRESYEVVQAVRRTTADAGALKRATSRAFYGLLTRIAKIRLQPGAADFRLMSRPAVDAFLSCRERVRFNRGLVQWIGFRNCEVPYDAPARHAGRSKYTWRRMFSLAADAIFSFSSWPLRVAGFAGGVVSLSAMGYLGFVLWAYFFTDRTIPGWTSILAAVLALGGVQLVVLWIVGEYVGRLYEEVKQRPIYVVRTSIQNRP